MDLTMHQRWSIPFMIVMVMTWSALYGRKRRQSGRPLTPFDQLLLGACNWAFCWLWVGLPSLLDWGQHMPWSEIVPAALFLFVLAVAPLGLFLTATWLPRLFEVTNEAAKETSRAGPARLTAPARAAGKSRVPASEMAHRGPSFQSPTILPEWSRMRQPAD